MKAHTTGFKNAVKELGRQLRAVITYGNVTLEEEIYAITPHFEGGLLKSIMKQLDLELSVDIPLETVLNCQIGILANGSYEMLNYGNYVVYKSEKQEDTNTYRLTCYDKMLYSMKQNEDLGIPYPISIKNYLIAICNKLGLTLKTTTFQNESRMIQNELYLGLDYTYRDILDEIAQATGSIICLNENDEVLVKYPTQTNDTIDEEFLKDVNVDFGQMYGAINTIVLSRSGESDNIYYPPELPENPIEIKIKDNQIMNWNDRSDYLPGIYNALNGLYYYINDFSSTGIMYYEVGDLYNIQVGENIYQCLMLNDEINITTGIEEIIHTDLPEQSETDYTKADKTDRRINQTYLIVDKQNQQISSVISQTIDRDNPDSMSNKLSKVSQTVDELNSKISDIADITTSLESNSAKLEFEGINQSEPIRVVIHPVGANISKLYPSTSLKPSTNLTIKTRILRFTNTTTQEVWNYEIPDDLLYYDSENYDEFILDYDSLSCVINKKCKWNNDGTVGLLPSERAVEYEFPHIELTDGDYTVELIQYSNGYIFARLMAQNIYTTQFATKAELNSEISQTTKGINLSVDKKLSNYSTTSQMNSAIDLKATEITSSVSENYATKETLNNNYSTTEQTATMISNTVSSMTKNNIETVTVEYALGTSTTTAPTSGWSTTAPTWQQGKYMWQRTKTKTADGTEQISDPTCISGAKGQDGTNGVSISSITEYYAVSSSNSSAPADSAFKTTMQTMTATNKYLWNYEVITYSNNNTQKTIKRVIGTYGDKGTDGTNGIGIKSVTNKYQVSTSNTTAPTSWKDTPQTMTATNKYLWNYEIITYSDNTTSTSTPAVIGTYGDKGNTGDTGKGVKAVVAQYYLSSSKTSQTGGSWSETQPAYKKDYYYWTRTKITWTDNTTTYTTPILVEEINSLNESVASLNIRTSSIESSVTEKVGKTEVGTYIEQNTESVKLAWNQISEYIQMMIINNNASFAILDENKNLLMSLDKEGQHFYKDGTTIFGEMGVQTVDYNNYIAFAVPTDYDTRINDGMAWGVTTSSDGKFHPILYIKNFTMPPKNSGGCTGELQLDGCNLVLGGENGCIIANGIKIVPEAVGGISFLNDEDNASLLTIISNSVIGQKIHMLDNISFYRNSAGSNTFKVGNDNNAYCLFTDEGSIHCSNIIISDGSNLVSIHPNGEVIGHDLNFDGLPSYQGQKLVYGQDGHRYYLDWTGSRLNFWVDTTNVGTLSDKRLKTEIQDIDEDFIKAIEEVEMKQFKVANRNGLISFGILAQDLIEIFKKYNKNPFDYEIVYKTQFRIDDDTIYYAINYEQFLILKQKAMDKKIEELQTKDKQKDEIISKLIERVEKLERKEIKNELHKNKLGG